MITLNFMVKEEIEENDVFNRNNSYDYSELISDFGDCNCMSYVFGAYEWMIPLDTEFEDATDILEELGIDYDEDLCAAIDNALDDLIFEYPLLIKLAIERMLKTFPDLRRIKNLMNLKTMNMALFMQQVAATSILVSMKMEFTLIKWGTYLQKKLKLKMIFLVTDMIVKDFVLL